MLMQAGSLCLFKTLEFGWHIYFLRRFLFYVHSDTYLKIMNVKTRLLISTRYACLYVCGVEFTDDKIFECFAGYYYCYCVRPAFFSNCHSHFPILCDNKKPTQPTSTETFTTQTISLIIFIHIV